jgi:hypothetical protein
MGSTMLSLQSPTYYILILPGNYYYQDHDNRSPFLMDAKMFKDWDEVRNTILQLEAEGDTVKFECFTFNPFEWN